MPEIQPFAALRYNPETVPLERVVVPPYDVIKEEQREQLAREPFSGVQLTLMTPREGDTPEDNKYTRSRDLFEMWRKDGVLVQDEAPALYVLAQDFTWQGKPYTRMHLVCACRLYEFSDRVILPHEKILQGPKDDRQLLIETSRANYEPLFILTMGDSARFREILAQQSQGKPMEDVTLPNGERNRVWRIGDPSIIAELQAILADQTCVIADGHHRYNASLGVKREMDAREGEGPWDFAMMTLAAMDDPDLLILPTHRMVSGLPSLDPERLLEKLDETFIIEERDDPEDTLARMDEMSGVAIGLVLGEHRYYVLAPWRPDALADVVPGDHSDAWKQLDVSVLHGVIMDRVLGLGAGESPHITYTRDAGEAIDAVRSGAAQISFLLKSTPKSAVEEIALNGETMPQKSTFFFPKLLTGLLMRAW